MQKICSKCGAETSYSGNLHCRSILIGGVKKILSLGKSKEAKDLILNSSGDKNWERWKEENFGRFYLEYKMQIELRKERVWFEKEEKLAEERRNRIIKTLAPAQSLLNNGNFLEADQFVFKKHHEELLKEYEKKKFEYVQTDLRNLEKELKEKRGYFDREKAAVLSATGKNILVQARAGSGKTTTIALRVRQLIKFYSAKPHEILVLAFNKKAAREFEVRINKYCHENIVDKSNTLTFHSLAYRLVNPGEQLLFNDLQDKNEFIRGQQTEFIGKIYDQILAKDRGTILTLLYNFFKALAKEKMQADFKNEADFYLYRKNLQYVSLGGERVKSKGEKFIADFLFEHKITKNDQEIEYKYEWNLPGEKRIYKPDFSLWSLNRVNGELPLAVFEYFGVTKKNQADRTYMSEVKEQEYLSDAKWKKEYCEKNNISFLSTSVDDFDGTTNERVHFDQILKLNLERRGFILQKLTQKEIIKKILKAKPNLDQLFEQITQFISRAKKQSLTPSDIRKLAESRASTLGERAKNFIKIVRRVYEQYQNSLEKENKIDFDDLLARATEKINQTHGDCELEILGENRKIKNIKYVLIDEYQDFSELFYKLIDAIKKSNPAISVFSVGDDWQAINGFAGSDLEYFDNFETYFVNGHKKSLLTNYRSRANIVQHSNLLMSDRGLGGKPEADKLPGAVYLSHTQYVEWRPKEEYSEKYQEDDKYRTAAKSLGGLGNKGMEISRYLKTVEYIVRGKADKEICLLFRTNILYGVKISKFTDKIREWCLRDIKNITSSTVHGFKGKENDVVIVVDANKGSYPKIHPDNELMELLGITMSKVLDEERRLFYVAITRAKEELFMLYEEEIGHSDFIFPEQWKYLSIS